MSFDTRILQLQKEWTDKYVVVDAARPELRRFDGQTGTVKTVNMSGRALVQFDANLNIGWYDIDLAYLKKIDAPLPKAEVKEAKAEKPKVAAKPAEAAKPAAAGAGGKNVADILAAARGGAKPAAAAPPAAEGKKASVADILAAARGGAKPAAAAPKAEATPAPKAEAPAADPKKMSVADIMAAARGKTPTTPKSEATAPPAPKAKASVAEKAAVPAPPPAAEPVAETSSGSKKGAFKTVAEIVDYCRKTDSK